MALKNHFTLLVLFASLLSASAQQPMTVYFDNCSPTLDDPYGICAHISMSDVDLQLREEEMTLAENIGVNFVRSDMLYPHFYNNDGKMTTFKFDSATACAKRHNISFLPITGRHFKYSFSWDNIDGYNSYITDLTSRYSDIKYWELINEVDLISGQGDQKTLSEKYISLLPSACDIIHKNGQKVVLGGMSKVSTDFFTELISHGAMKYADIMNFHMYTNQDTPESAEIHFRTIKNTFNKYNIMPSVWLTETGYHTERASSRRRVFILDVLPEVIKKLNIASNATIGIIDDDNIGFHAATEGIADDIEHIGLKIKWINLNDISNLRPQDVPLLIPTSTEAFPMQYFNDLENYVRNGGTLLLTQGVPFYYDQTNDGPKVASGEYRHRLHIGIDFPWEEAAKKKGVTAMPTVYGKTDAISTEYNWSPEGEQTTRYLNGDRLAQGDSLITICYAGNNNYQGCVVGVYKFNSNLKGNIIFTTAFDYGSSISADLQAKRLTRTYLMGLSAGLDKIFWYNLRAVEKNKNYAEDNFGIIHNDQTPKPAYLAYKNLVKMLPNHSKRPSLSIDYKKGIYICEWKTPDGKETMAIWTSTGAKKTIMTPRKYRRGHVISNLGDKLGRAKKHIEIDNGVKYIVAK